jgi:serine-type D-Ala-D-Ala carboxypeptidase/endopeptidase (penicillin-binding protein 4)
MTSGKRPGFVHLIWIVVILLGCSASQQIKTTGTTSLDVLLNDSTVKHAFVGILIQNADDGGIVAALNEHKYFVPASNTKLWSMYAALKHLGDSLVAGYVANENDSVLVFRSNGDPTFLHPDFAQQPLANMLKGATTVKWLNPELRTTPYGNGWSWNDYEAAYMAPRSSLPMFGNVATFILKDGKAATDESIAATMLANGSAKNDTTGFSVKRKFDDGLFTIETGRMKIVNTPLYLTPETNRALAAAYFKNRWMNELQTSDQKFHAVYSQPTDSMQRPMMHRSDNFFAEQSLLMVSNQMLGYMSDEAVIDTLLKSDLAALPDKPRWVDGSGLSRYNLFTPADYVWLLSQMHSEFPMQRLQDILPTGNDGTLTNYYPSLQGKLFAKTGTLSGVVSLSGYLYAKSGKLLLFSILVNNHNGSGTAVRRAVEKYLVEVWQKN